MPAGLCRPRAGLLSLGAVPTRWKPCGHQVTPRERAAPAAFLGFKGNAGFKTREERALLRDKNVPEISGGFLPPHGARGSPGKSKLAPRGPHPHSGSPQGLHHPR